MADHTATTFDAASYPTCLVIAAMPRAKEMGIDVLHNSKLVGQLVKPNFVGAIDGEAQLLRLARAGVANARGTHARVDAAPEHQGRQADGRAARLASHPTRFWLGALCSSQQSR